MASKASGSPWWRLGRVATLLRHAREIQRETGKSVPVQIGEILSLRFGSGRLSPLHYYQYGLYDDRRYPWEHKREFISWPVDRLGGRVNDPQWHGPIRDKLSFYAFLRGNDIPHPEVVAYYHPGGRRVGGAPCLRTPEAVADFLRTRMPYPCFGKPAHANYGRGASLVEAWLPERDRLRLAGGEELPVETYVEQFVRPHGGRSSSLASRDAYIFQRVIAQDPWLEPIIGPRVSTVRMIVLVHDDGPRLHRAIWRIPAGGNVTDNFVAGTAGNLLAMVDRDSGVVQHAIVGRGRGTDAADPRGTAVETTVHPDTGATLVGLQLRDWARVRAFTFDAAATLPRVRYQSWDIALADGGPMVVELNFYGDYLQPGHDRGLNDPDMQAFLARYAR